MNMNQVTPEVKVKTWTPAIPCKIPDNIVSSQFTSAKVFVPSYEKEKRSCMEQLLTNEYQRIWWQEKEMWDKRFSSQITTKKLLHRMRIRRKPPTGPTTDKQKQIKRSERKKISKATETKTVEEQGVEEKIKQKEKSNVEDAVDISNEDEKAVETAERQFTEEKENEKTDDVIKKAA